VCEKCAREEGREKSSSGGPREKRRGKIGNEGGNSFSSCESKIKRGKGGRLTGPEPYREVKEMIVKGI